MTEKELNELVDGETRTSRDPKHAPLSLPAGSFDVDALKAATNKAVTGAAAKRDEAIDKAIKDAAAETTNLDSVDTAAQAGYEQVEIENKALGVTEKARVYNPGKEAESTATDAPVKE